MSDLSKSNAQDLNSRSFIFGGDASAKTFVKDGRLVAHVRVPGFVPDNLHVEYELYESTLRVRAESKVNKGSCDSRDEGRISKIYESCNSVELSFPFRAEKMRVMDETMMANYKDGLLTISAQLDSLEDYDKFNFIEIPVNGD